MTPKRKKNRRYPAEAQVQRLVDWLNEGPASGPEAEKRWRVGQFINSVQGYLNALIAEAERGEYQAPDRIMQKLIEPEFRRFREASDLVISDPRDDYHGLKFGFRRRESTDYPCDEWGYFALAVTLAREGNIHRVGQCVCGVSMFVKFPYGDRAQRFHPDHPDCAKQEKKRVMKYYMQERREKEKEEAANALAKIKRGGTR